MHCLSSNLFTELYVSINAQANMYQGSTEHRVNVVNNSVLVLASSFDLKDKLVFGQEKLIGWLCKGIPLLYT